MDRRLEWTFSRDEDSPTVRDVKRLVAQRLAVEASDFRLLRWPSSRDLLDDELFCPLGKAAEVPAFENTFLVDVAFRLRGGKGGFGSNLRAMGGRMSSQKATNNDACRDLQGRRLKTVNEAKKLADYAEQEAERKRQEKERLEKKIAEGLKEPEKKKIRFDDAQFVADHEKVRDDVKDAVSKGGRLSVTMCTIQDSTEQSATGLQKSMAAKLASGSAKKPVVENVKKPAKSIW